MYCIQEHLAGRHGMMPMHASIDKDKSHDISSHMLTRQCNRVTATLLTGHCCWCCGAINQNGSQMLHTSQIRCDHPKAVVLSSHAELWPAINDQGAHHDLPPGDPTGESTVSATASIDHVRDH
mmetsp:Transcript_32828/g.65342  ORF Transcript_32828/g.65342 Transcript_32828/m.65342 type:complete len:123 (-) Transcript_32828:582-950(-)